MIESYYSLHGLCVQSSLELGAPRAEPTDRPDLRVSAAVPHSVSDGPPAGKILAEIGANGFGYAVARSEAGFTIRFYSTCEFFVDPTLESVSVRRAASCPEELAALFLEGPVLSTLLTLKGHCVVHASAVQLGDRNLAFIGPSGLGKSTLAAALCSVGARLISDDTLRCDLGGGGALCFSATRCIRLRPAARPLTDTEGSPALTVDGRFAVNPSLVVRGSHPLHGLLAPKRAQGNAVTTERLTGVDALTQLAVSARIACWQSPEMRSKQFSMLAALGRALPVFALATPHDALFTAPGREQLAQVLAKLELGP